MPKISIIILSYNTAEMTKNCLLSIERITKKEKFNNFEIIIIDNGSNDHSVATIEKLQRLKAFNRLEGFKLIKNKHNFGYPKGNNQGLNHARGQYILFLNSDIVLDKVEFVDIINYMDRNKDVGGLTVRVNLNHSGIDPASHRGFPTIWRSFCYFSGLEKLFGKVTLLNKLFGGYHLLHLNLKKIHEIDSPSGALFLSRKSILDKLHGFDEDFFIYGEDLDLSYRIKKLGYRIIYYPHYQVTHFKYTSGLKSKDNQNYREIRRHYFEAMKIFYKKHYQQRHPDFINNLIYLFIDLVNKLSSI